MRNIFVSCFWVFFEGKNHDFKQVAGKIKWGDQISKDDAFDQEALNTFSDFRAPWLDIRWMQRQTNMKVEIVMKIKKNLL